MKIDDEREIQLQVQCREGPIRERTCTDWGCCLLYFLFMASIVVMAVIASNEPQVGEAMQDRLLRTKGKALPFLSIQKAMPFILSSLGTVTGICLLIVVTTYLLPAIAAYLFIPIMLLLMLLMGVGFTYRFFGKRLPFVNRQLQSEYASSYSLISLLIGLTFIIGFVVSLIVILTKQQRIKFIFALLKLSKICFWDNIYTFGISIVLSVISIGLMILNLKVISLSVRYHDDTISYKWSYIIPVLFQILWTHGVTQAYSDFLYQSIAVFWYFNESKYRNEEYSGFSKNFCTSFGLSIRHFGTIVFGSILVYYPQSLNSMLITCEESHENCYSVFCCCHKMCCQLLSKYCYLGTIMYGHPFCRASASIKNIRATAKHTFPELYMIGSFYVTLMKIFIILVGLITIYLLIIVHSEFSGSMNYIAPLIVPLCLFRCAYW